MERVNRSAFLNTSNCNDFKTLVQVFSNYRLISSNCFPLLVVAFESIGGKRKELPEIDPKAHVMEQVKGIEPSTRAWEALILPLNYTCVFAALSVPLI